MSSASHFVDHPQFSEFQTDGRLKCTLCPRDCHLKDGQRGLCFVRQRQGEAILLTSYGRSSGFVIDPIEKKPLSHFLPGSSVLSFGTVGCNLSCKFCQNWDMSKSQAMDILQSPAMPTDIAQAALAHGCASVAFTYNDPVIFYEYAVDTAKACRQAGIKTVVVSAGYIQAEARAGFFRYMDAVNLDLKGFSQSFYRDLCTGSLQPVLDTLSYLIHETEIWTEITTLLIPGENDSEEELQAMTAWVASELGTHIPLHFSAFHPDYKMMKHPATPHDTLLKAKAIAKSNGLNYSYIGNVHDPSNASTYCSGCGALLIGRDSYQISDWNLDQQAACITCGLKLPGKFDTNPGSWGNKYQRIQINKAP